MTDENKAEALDEIKESFRYIVPKLKHAENIPLVIRYYDELKTVLRAAND